MFGKKKKIVCKPYDRTAKKPVIRASICTGEQVAGFRDLAGGRFEELAVIRGEKDLADFCERYGVDAGEIVKEY